MFTEIFIVEIPDQFNDLGAGGERPKHRGSVIEDAPYFFIQLFRGLVQMDGERHIRLASAVLPMCCASSSKQALIASFSYQVITHPGREYSASASQSSMPGTSFSLIWPGHACSCPRP